MADKEKKSERKQVVLRPSTVIKAESLMKHKGIGSFNQLVDSLIEKQYDSLFLNDE